MLYFYSISLLLEHMNGVGIAILFQFFFIKTGLTVYFVYDKLLNKKKTDVAAF